jgi:hypothetical protein
MEDLSVKTQFVYLMVPGVGIEPTRLAAADFESAASANSATRAKSGDGGK